MVAPTSFFADYGCHVRILEEARVLQRLGHQVTIVTYRNGRDLPDLDIRRTLPIPWRQHYEVGSSRHKIVFDALLGAKTLQLLARRRFDVIHAHLHEGALIAQVLGGLFRIPVLFDFQGSLTEEMIDHHFLTRAGRPYRWLRRLEERIDRAAPIIFTSSSNAENVLTGEFGCEPERIRPLPDCVNTQEFRPATSFDPAELAALRQRLGVPAGARVVVYLGLLAEYQGTPHLLQAMQRIKTTHPDVYLLMMGFPGVDFYAARAQALGVEDRVIFTGRVFYEQAPLHLALGDVAVAPKLSLTESAGKLLNYMAAALPTIAFDTPVAREYLGAHGVFAERGSVDSLAAKLADLIDNKSLATVLGDRLRQRAVEHFEWQRAGLQIVDAYDELVERPSRRRQAVAPPVPQE
ncbi:MAG: glycosyltransferase family 4 protein [Anaerolineales bacterium]|nr:glycosyltransferase family 4 protein [Anaerolineales bacterium]